MRSLTGVEKWSYAIGNMPYSIKDAAFIHFVVFYYTQVQGLSGTLAGLAMFIALCWDAVTDPVVGSWSDGVNTRWGRRHPLILGGGLPMSLLFIALFAPPDGLGQAGTFIWLTGVAMLLRTFLTVNFIPFQAMGAELSQDYDERTVIAKARVAMGWLAGMAMPAFAFAVIFTSGGDGDGRLVEANYETYGLVSALLAALTTVVCVWGTRTVIPRLPQGDPNAPRFGLGQTVTDFRMAARNRNFRFALGSSLAFGAATGVYSTLALYLGTYFWEFSSEQLAGLVLPTAVGTLAAFAVLNRLGRRFEKATILWLAALGLAFNTLWFIGARLLGLLPANGHAILYPLILLSTFLGTFMVVCVHAISASLFADILDEHEVDTGRRQEGVFFAANAFVLKATTGLGTLLAGIAIDLAGIAPGSEPGTIPEPALNSLGLLYVVLTTAMCVASFGFTRRIRMSRADHAQLQAQLQARLAAG